MVKLAKPVVDLTSIVESIKAHEGLVLHEYKDHLGYSTIGYGRLIDQRRGGGITEDEALHLLHNDIADITNRLDRAFPWWTSQPVAVQNFIVELCYQLGVSGFSKFKKAIAHLQTSNIEGAKKEFLDSRWGKEQTPSRANRMVARL